MLKAAPFKQMYSTVTQLKSTVESIQDGVDRVRNSTMTSQDQKPFALVAESAMAKYYTMKEPCDLYMVGDLTTIGSYAMVLPSGSPDLMKVDLALLSLRESGKLRELENKWFSGVCTDFIMDSSSGSRIQLPPFYEVDLGTFSGALIILGMGLVLGAIVTGLEVLVFRYAESILNETIMKALKLMEEVAAEQSGAKVVMLGDSKSVLKKLEGPKAAKQRYLGDALQ
ncbi:glutamate receptor 1 [Elysia marginata]|uniref:Glutamate receptor 1 n=1 Tax=Elysia marginata TaxID=1093978 RepID=A0AAV4JAI6_9GAST|nr:glutamate receptor 1 [Elysia marginata]